MPELMQEVDGNLNETLESLWRVVVRHRWWILFSVGAATLIALVALAILPRRYRSEATLLVIQQQVPERFVLPTTTTDIREALQATTQEVLSRDRLQAIIEEFGLYAKQAKRLSPEALVSLMQRDIDIQPVDGASQGRSVNSFKISFIADTPQLAQAVTSKLTSLFIEQHLETREHQATATTTFLEDQLEIAKNKLEQAEKLVSDFKLLHLGELPEQQEGNVTILGGLQSQLQATLSNLNRAREQRQYLESLSDNRSLMIQGDLARLQSQREALLLRYTPEYPAVKRLEEKIAQTEALLKTLRASQTSGNPSAQTGLANSEKGIAEDTSIAQLNSQLEANRLEIANLTEDKKRLEKTITEYQNRINQTPVREQEIAGILRNYELMKQDYGDLLNKKMQSELAGDLEKRQEGQQFRLLDQASLPTLPISPDRAKISLGGIAAGLGLGLALVFVMEMRDRSFHSENDLKKRFALPLVVGVPMLLSPVERRSRVVKRNFELVLGSGLAMAVAAVEFYELYLFRHF